MLPGFHNQNSTDLSDAARELADVLGALDPQRLQPSERSSLRELLDALVELIDFDGLLVRPLE
jgi:hypothetical protein